MTGKTWGLLLTLLACAAIYAARFTDWFHPVGIQISVSNRPLMPGQSAGAVLPLVFGLGNDYQLTSLKVLALDPANTNKTTVVWQLAGNPKSEPIRGFLYGDAIAGMTPVVGGKAPPDLVPGQAYLVEVAAGRFKGVQPFLPQAPAN